MGGFRQNRGPTSILPRRRQRRRPRRACRPRAALITTRRGRCHARPAFSDRGAPGEGFWQAVRPPLAAAAASRRKPPYSTPPQAEFARLDDTDAVEAQAPWPPCAEPHPEQDDGSLPKQVTQMEIVITDSNGDASLKDDRRHHSMSVHRQNMAAHI